MHNRKMPPLIVSGRRSSSSRAGMPPLSIGGDSSSSSSPSAARHDSGGDDEFSTAGASNGNLAYLQLETYNLDPKELIQLNDTHKDSLSRIVRNQVFSRVKFLNKSGREHEKILDRFGNLTCWSIHQSI